MNYYHFHLGDYFTATKHLSWDEDLAYRRLIDAYYTSEKPLTLAQDRLYHTVGAVTMKQRDAVDRVLKEFFTETTEGYWHERCEEEIAKYSEKRAKASESANRRWQGKTNAMRTHKNGNAPTPIPNINKHAKGKEGEAARVPVFENTEAWKAWKATGKRFSAQDIRTEAGIRRGWYFPTEFPQQEAGAA